MQTIAEQLQTNQNQEQFDQRERIWNDTETWLAEALNGSMQTTFEYRFDGKELYGEDGGELGEIFDDAIETAELIANKNPNLLFELRRRLIERDEYDDMLAMARGEAENTMVVLSDFPPELMDSSHDVGGYNAGRKQTMMRVISKTEAGVIKMTTQSLDGSDRTALESIYHQLGALPQEGELLEQRIMLDLPHEWQSQLATNLTDVYDASLAEQKGGAWHAGIQQNIQHSQLNTYEFVQAQQDLVEWFVEAKLQDPEAAEKLRYNLAATAAQRLESFHKDPDTAAVISMPNSVPLHILASEIENAGARAASQGKVFSGCGASVGIKNELDELGFGNNTEESTIYKFDKKMHCVVCQRPPKEGEGKKKCGPCGICKGCDGKLGGKG
jgi:hypothetical protein